jgi:acyl-CoA thioesterase YciA
MLAARDMEQGTAMHGEQERNDRLAQDRPAEKLAPQGALTVRVIAMPADTNANGDIFGGWVMSRMDQAGGIAGVERARGRVVTVSIDAMTFIQPMRVGDVLEVYTEVRSIGRTSMKIHIEAWAMRFRSHRRDKVTDANFTFVAIDDEGRPRPIPRDIPKDE